MSDKKVKGEPKPADVVASPEKFSRRQLHRAKLALAEKPAADEK